MAPLQATATAYLLPNMVISAVKCLPKAALAPLREDLVRVGHDKKYDEQLRTTARELLIGLEYGGASSSSGRTP